MGLKVLGWGYLVWCVVFGTWVLIDGGGWGVVLGVCFLGGILALVCLPFVLVGDTARAGAALLNHKAEQIRREKAAWAKEDSGESPSPPS
jgi:hypothetical protein